MIFLTKYKVIFIFMAVILVILLFSFFLKKFMKYWEKKKEITMAAADRMRDENLNNVILNSYVDKDSNKEVYVPYDVNYGSSDKCCRKKENKENAFIGRHGQLMLQLTERTELSTRKFVLNPAKRIRIGSNQQDNDISVQAEGVSPYHCEIFAIGRKIYVRNNGEGNRTILKRRKERAIVDNKGIRLLSGDSLLLGSVSYDITIIEQLAPWRIKE